MTQLLVSVRNATEATRACAAGADIVDIKEPSRGPLGAADAGVVRDVVEAVSGTVPLSAALGELLDANCPYELEGVSYAKYGQAGCAVRLDWRERWQSKILQLPVGTAPVAVVYADAAAGSPPLDDVLAAAESVRAPVLLIDTYDKRAGSLLAHWTPAKVARVVKQAHEAGLKIALAGSLDEGAIRELLSVQPDIFGVRGAVCRGGRTGLLDEVRIRRLARLMAQASRREFQPG